MDKGLPLIARAAAAAPQRPDLAWLHIQFCGISKGCDPAPLELHLQALDPTNGVAWLDPPRWGSGPVDTTQRRERLAAVANSERFDVYLNTTITHAVNAILKTGAMDPETALTSVLGMASAVAIPAYGLISQMCKGTVMEAADVLADCRRASAVFRRGDTNLSEVIGTTIAMRAWPEGSAEYVDALATRRTLRYRMEMALKADLQAAGDEGHAKTYLQLLSTHRTEQEMYLAQIINAGLNPDPPADWKDTLFK